MTAQRGHFERASRRSPKPTLWMEGGGMVTRCGDPEVARPLLVAEYLDDNAIEPGDFDTVAEYEAFLSELMPLDKAEVQRGRVVPCNPDMYDGYAWTWRRVREGATGRGITTAVVWQDNR